MVRQRRLGRTCRLGEPLLGSDRGGMAHCWGYHRCRGGAARASALPGGGCRIPGEPEGGLTYRFSFLNPESLGSQVLASGDPGAGSVLTSASRWERSPEGGEEPGPRSGAGKGGVPERAEVP